MTPEPGTEARFRAYYLAGMRSDRKLRRLVFSLLMYLALCSIGGVYLADATLHPGRRDLTQEEVAAFKRTVKASHAEVEDVAITTPDTTVLRGWMIRSQHNNGEAALLLHGLGDNRLGMTGYAQLLLAHGFTVLLPDARAHGTSGGTLATFGLLERQDIRQWVDFLRVQARVPCVYGLGESIGAAQLLQTLETGAAFCAIVAESPFSSFREIAYDRMGQPFGLGPWIGRTILRPLVEIAFLRAWKYGLDMQQISPEDAVGTTQVPVLLIHGQIDGNIPIRHSRRIHSRNPRTILWEIPGADHCGALAMAPEEFETRLLAWFTPTSALKNAARRGF